VLVPGRPLLVPSGGLSDPIETSPFRGMKLLPEG
jgi:hypothetical protein